MSLHIKIINEQTCNDTVMKCVMKSFDTLFSLCHVTGQTADGRMDDLIDGLTIG